MSITAGILCIFLFFSRLNTVNRMPIELITKLFHLPLGKVDHIRCKGNIATVKTHIANKMIKRAQVFNTPMVTLKLLDNIRSSQYRTIDTINDNKLS